MNFKEKAIRILKKKLKKVLLDQVSGSCLLYEIPATKDSYGKELSVMSNFQHPKDLASQGNKQNKQTYTSLEVVYTLSKMDSGDIHFTGNNPVVFFKQNSSLQMSRASPKSAIFMMQSSPTNTLRAAKSRWINCVFVNTK